MGNGEWGCESVVRICGLMRMHHCRIRTSLVCGVSDPRRLARICVCGSVPFRPEQICAVTVSEQQRSVGSISRQEETRLTATDLAISSESTEWMWHKAHRCRALSSGEPDGFRLVWVECEPVNTKPMVKLNETLFYEPYSGSRYSRSIICILLMLDAI